MCFIKQFFFFKQTTFWCCKIKSSRFFLVGPHRPPFISLSLFFFLSNRMRTVRFVDWVIKASHNVPFKVLSPFEKSVQPTKKQQQPIDHHRHRHLALCGWIGNRAFICIIYIFFGRGLMNSRAPSCFVIRFAREPIARHHSSRIWFGSSAQRAAHSFSTHGIVETLFRCS